METKTAKCIKCGLRFRLHSWKEGNEKTHCFNCKIIQDMLDAIIVSARTGKTNRKIIINWEVVK